MTCFIFYTDPTLVFFKRGVDSGPAYRGPQDNTQDLLYFIDEQLGRLPKVTKYQCLNILSILYILLCIAFLS